jgi:hypothetical protein
MAYVEDQRLSRGLIEVGTVKCDWCACTYRLFTSGDHGAQSTLTAPDVNDLRERAVHQIHLDCPTSVPEGMPKGTKHLGAYEFLQDGKVAV